MVKQVNKELYDLICTWWEARSWPVIPWTTLPSNGYVVYEDEKPIIAGFLYLSDSALGMIEWIVASPDTTKEERARGFDRLMEELLKTAKENDIQILYTSLNHPKLIEKYEKHNFVKAETDVTNMICILGG